MVDVSNLERGPCPGLLGDVAAMHGRYYAKHWGFPIVFEDKVAREMGAFLQRYDPARDLILWLGDEHRVRGSITIDGSDTGFRARERFRLDLSHHFQGIGFGDGAVRAGGIYAR
jgi:hypothetical protein